MTADSPEAVYDHFVDTLDDEWTQESVNEPEDEETSYEMTYTHDSEDYRLDITIFPDNIYDSGINYNVYLDESPE